MTAVVTGASGHLGNTLVRALAASGCTVRACFRSPPPYTLPPSAEAVMCDLQNGAGLEQAFDGADVVYHTAGLVSFGIGSRKALNTVNVTGTKNVIEACKKSAVDRLIYIGSIEAFDLLAGEYPITESSRIDPERTVMWYGRTKALATIAVEEAAGSNNFDAVVIVPTGFVGPSDYKNTAMTSMVRDFLRGRIPASISGGFDFVDVRDVAHAAIAAAKPGNRSGRYLVSGHYASVAELLALLEDITGKKAPRFVIPPWLSQLWGFVSELYYAVSGNQPRYTRKSIKILSLGVSVSSELAARELGYKPRELRQSLEDMVSELTE